MLEEENIGRQPNREDSEHYPQGTAGQRTLCSAEPVVISDAALKHLLQHWPRGLCSTCYMVHI